MFAHKHHADGQIASLAARDLKTWVTGHVEGECVVHILPGTVPDHRGIRILRRIGRSLHRCCRHHQHIEFAQHCVIGSGQFPTEILRLRIVASTTGFDHVFADHHCVFDSVGQLIGTHAPSGMSIDHAGHVEPFPVKAVAVVFHHLLRRAFGGDDRPDGGTILVHWDGNFFDIRAELLELISGLSDAFLNVLFSFRPTKAFLQNTDAQTLDPFVERLRVSRRLVEMLLARIEPVCTGNGFKKKRIVGYCLRHRPKMIEGAFNRHCPGVGHHA